MTSGPRDVAALVAAIEPFDDTERAHRADTLTWPGARWRDLMSA